MLPVLRVGPAAIQSSVLAILVALYAGTWFAERECRRRGLKGDEAWNVVVLGAAVTIVFARLVYVAQNLPAYAADWSQILSPAPGTLSLGYGALFGLIAAYAYVQRRSIPFARFADALAPGALVAAAIIAVGQFLGGDAYGAPTSVPWAIFLWGETRHPVQLYDAAITLLGAWAIWQMARANPTRDGLIALNAIAWYAWMHVFVDAFRGDATLLPGGYRASQVIALVILLIALWSMARLEMKEA